MYPSGGMAASAEKQVPFDFAQGKLSPPAVVRNDKM